MPAPECTCRLGYYSIGGVSHTQIVHCPLHEAAGQLYEACEAASVLLGQSRSILTGSIPRPVRTVIEQCGAALADARRTP